MIFIKILVIMAFVFMIYMNYLANSKPLGGITTGEISNKYNTMFTPSGFTFSIWGVIYLLLLIFVVNFTIQKSTSLENMQLLGLLFVLTCVFNVVWLVCWHFDKILLSTIVMVLLLSSLLVILKYTNPVGITNISMSIYAGWISIALVANISILLFKYDVSFFMKYETFWFYTVLIITLVIGVYMTFFQKNYYYGAVFIWAYFGIIMRYLG